MMEYASCFVNAMSVVDNEDDDLWAEVVSAYKPIIEFTLQDKTIPGLSVIHFTDDSTYVSYNNNIYITEDKEGFIQCFGMLMAKHPIIKEGFYNAIKEFDGKL